MFHQCKLLHSAQLSVSWRTQAPVGRAYEAEVSDCNSFWRVMIERYGIDLKLIKPAFDSISKNGSFIVIANSPYGILDGLVMGYTKSEIRGDF